MTDDVPTPLTTAGSGEDFAVLYGVELTVEADGSGTAADAFVETRAPEQGVKIHIEYTLSGITDVTVSPLSDLADTTEYEAADNQPKRGTRWVAEGEPVVEIVPESQVHNRVVTDGGVPGADKIDIEGVDFERLKEEVGAERVYFALENGSDAVEFRHDGVHLPQLFLNNGEVRHGFSSPDGLFSAGLTMSPEQARTWARVFEVAVQLAEENDDHGTII